VSRGTHASKQSPALTAYGTLTRSGRPFQQRSAQRWVCHSVVALPRHLLDRPTPGGHRRQPVPPAGFGLLPFRSPLLRECSLFLGVLRCFSSPTDLHRGYRFTAGSPGITPVGLPHSDILGSALARSSPRRFVAWPRPSSAPDTEASTVCSSCGAASVRSRSAQSRLARHRPSTARPNDPQPLAHPPSQIRRHWCRSSSDVLRMVLPCFPLLRCSLSTFADRNGGAEGIRTPDLRRAKAALSRLSYSPIVDDRLVGVRGLEPRASPLSGVCSHQLS
jgi:hypothetical protein